MEPIVEDADGRKMWADLSARQEAGTATIGDVLLVLQQAVLLLDERLTALETQKAQSHPVKATFDWSDNPAWADRAMREISQRLADLSRAAQS